MDFDSFDWMQESGPDEGGPELETARQLPRPIRHDRHVEKREYINGLKKQALNELIPTLPDEQTEVYILSNGSGGTYRLHDLAQDCFEFGHFIPVLVERLGNKAVSLYAATWTMNRQHSLNLLQMLDDGQLGSVTLFTDAYFKRREAAVANELIAGLVERGQTYRAFKCHTKALTLRNAEATRFVTVFSSANFSSQPRTENFTLNTAPDCHYWLVKDYFEAMLNAKRD